MECEGCGITDELVLERYLKLPKDLGGKNDSDNQTYLCANCQKRISVISEEFRQQFFKLTKIGIVKKPEESKIIQKLSEPLQKILILQINAWIKRELKKGKVSIKF